MPAPVIVVHPEGEFLASVEKALEAAGHHVAAFADSMSALKAAERAEKVEVLVTLVRHPEGKPNGAAIARMIRLRRPGVKVILLGEPDVYPLVKDDGVFVPVPASPGDVLRAVQAEVPMRRGRR